MAIDPKAHVTGLWEEFKNFAFKGNIVDLTIGFIIGAGFTVVVKSAVDNIIMPIVGLVMPDKKGLDGMVWHIGGTQVPDPKMPGAMMWDGGSTVFYGKFIGDTLTFLVTALVVFIVVVKFLGWVMRSRQEVPVVPPAPPEPTKEELLLTEIRDILRTK